MLNIEKPSLDELLKAGETAVKGRDGHEIFRIACRLREHYPSQIFLLKFLAYWLAKCGEIPESINIFWSAKEKGGSEAVPSPEYIDILHQQEKNLELIDRLKANQIIMRYAKSEIPYVRQAIKSIIEDIKDLSPQEKAPFLLEIVECIDLRLETTCSQQLTSIKDLIIEGLLDVVSKLQPDQRMTYLRRSIAYVKDSSKLQTRIQDEFGKAEMEINTEKIKACKFIQDLSCRFIPDFSPVIV